MLNKTRAKLKKFLYELKDNVKSVSSGFIIENENASIIDLINDGFNKMEYFHTLEVKYSISSILDMESEEKKLSPKRAYAEFSLYVTLIGYLDNAIASYKELYDRLVKENNEYYVVLAGKISSASSLRKSILEDYLEESSYKEENYIKTLLAKNPAYENFSDLIAMTSSNGQGVFLISGFIQAYLEGFKRKDNTDIDAIITFYQKRQKEYFKYKEKCQNDLKEVKSILQK